MLRVVTSVRVGTVGGSVVVEVLGGGGGVEAVDGWPAEHFLGSEKQGRIECLLACSPTHPSLQVNSNPQHSVPIAIPTTHLLAATAHIAVSSTRRQTPARSQQTGAARLDLRVYLNTPAPGQRRNRCLAPGALRTGAASDTDLSYRGSQGLSTRDAVGKRG